MPAITGNYKPPNKIIDGWVVTWVYHPERWSSPRNSLANQLAHIRKHHGSSEAKEFRNYLLWIGCYPVRLRNQPA